MKLILLFVNVWGCTAALNQQLRARPARTAPTSPTSSTGEDAHDHGAFSAWARKFHKTHSAKEAGARMANFLRSRSDAQRKNELENSATFSVFSDPFADLSPEERAALFPPRSAEVRFDNITYTMSADKGAKDLNAGLDGDIDWRNNGAVTPVKDQGPHGTCWAFSTVAATEGAWATAGHGLVPLSEQQVIDCGDPSQPGQPYGFQQAMCVEPTAPLGTESSYPKPYAGDPSAGGCAVSGGQGGACISGVTCRPNSACGAGEACEADEDQIRAMLQSGPMSISIASRGLSGYNGGVIKQACSDSALDHAVTLVGYANDDADGNGPHWILKNSWGDGFGENGFFRLQYGVNCLKLAGGGPCQPYAPQNSPFPAPPAPAPTPTPTHPAPPAPAPAPPAPTPDDDDDDAR